MKSITSLVSQFVVLFSALASFTCTAPAAAQPSVAVIGDEGKIRVEIDGELFTEYVYAGRMKPILYPVHGPSGVPMTRNFPMRQNVPGEEDDHPHHESMWFAHGSVNGIDFWLSEDDCGKQVQEKIVVTTSDALRGSLVTKNRWVAPSGETVCTDTRRITFHVLEDARAIDWDITIHASAGDLVFGDTKEGTFAARVHPNLKPGDEPQRLVNSHGDHGTKAWGKRAPWVDYWGTINGHIVGMAIFDHPLNLRHPTWWHARNYGLFAANPFGIHDFEQQPAGVGECRLANGDNLRLRYRVLLHRGDASQAQLDARYQEYAGRF